MLSQKSLKVICSLKIALLHYIKNMEWPRWVRFFTRDVRKLYDFKLQYRILRRASKTPANLFYAVSIIAFDFLNDARMSNKTFKTIVTPNWEYVRDTKGLDEKDKVLQEFSASHHISVLWTSYPVSFYCRGAAPLFDSYIAISSNLANSDYPKESMGFVLQHEYGHHRQKHWVWPVRVVQALVITLIFASLRFAFIPFSLPLLSAFHRGSDFLLCSLMERDADRHAIANCSDEELRIQAEVLWNPKEEHNFWDTHPPNAVRIANIERELLKRKLE